MKKTKAVKKSRSIQRKKSIASGFRFLKHVVDEAPRIFWRIATFNTSTSAIREEIILPLANILENLKKEGLSLEEKEFNTFKLILYWPELILKIPSSIRKAAINLGFEVVTKAPGLYKENKNIKISKEKILNSIKIELGLDKLQEALALHTNTTKRKKK